MILSFGYEVTICRPENYRRYKNVRVEEWSKKKKIEYKIKILQITYEKRQPKINWEKLA